MQQRRSDNTLILVAVIAIAAVFSTRRASAQQIAPNEILIKAASNGEETAASFDKLVRYEELRIEAVGIGNNVTGEYYRLARIYRDKTQRITEKVFEEKSTLPGDA